MKRFKNKIVIYDALTKEKILEKENLVVKSGRVFMLEKLSDILAPGNVTSNAERKLIFFSIGSGGTSLGEYDSPLVPLDSDTGLAQPIPFTALNDGKYCKLVDNNYYGKFFEEPPTSAWDIDDELNKVSLFYSVKISPTDARGEVVNEMSFNFGRLSNGEVVDDGMFSRITFSSLFLKSDVSYDIMYYIYA